MVIIGTHSNIEARVGQVVVQVPLKIQISDFGAFLSTKGRHETRFNLFGTEWGVTLEFTRDSQSSRGFDVVRQEESDSPQYLAAFINGTNKTRENLNLNLEVDFELEQGPARLQVFTYLAGSHSHPRLCSHMKISPPSIQRRNQKIFGGKLKLRGLKLIYVSALISPLKSTKICFLFQYFMSFLSIKFVRMGCILL